MKTTHKMYAGTPFSNLPIGMTFKSRKRARLVYTKVKPSMNPMWYNAVSTNTEHEIYTWFGPEEIVHVQS